MRFIDSFLLMAVLVFLAVSVSTAESSQNKLRHADTSASSLGSADEERGAWEGFKRWAKTKWWANMGYSDDVVKEKLGIVKATDDVLAKNKYYQEYLRHSESNLLSYWLEKKVSPGSVFKYYKLDNLADPTKGAKYETFVRYATKYDKKVVKSEGSTYSSYTPWNPGYSRKSEGTVFSFPPYYPQTPAEKKIYVEIWANARREDAYVKAMLGIKDGTFSANERYFEAFKKLKKEEWGLW